jgi:hypothetical protein
MTAFRKIAVSLATLVVLGTSAPALADSRVIQADSTSVIEFYACGEFFLIAAGDHDTTLTFSSSARPAGCFMLTTMRPMSR